METKQRTVDQEVEHLKELYPNLLTNLVVKTTLEIALRQRIKTKTGPEKKHWQNVYNEIKKLY